MIVLSFLADLCFCSFHADWSYFAKKREEGRKIREACAKKKGVRANEREGIYAEHLESRERWIGG